MAGGGGGRAHLILKGTFQESHDIFARTHLARMQSRVGNTHPGAKEHGLRGLKGRDGKWDMLSIGRERERILGRTFCHRKNGKETGLTVIHLLF